MERAVRGRLGRLDAALLRHRQQRAAQNELDRLARDGQQRQRQEARARAHQADLERQARDKAARVTRLQRQERWRTQHTPIVRRTTVDLALAIQQHRLETPDDTATEADRLLWTMLHHLTLPNDDPDTGPVTLRAIVDQIHDHCRRRGTPPPDVLGRGPNAHRRLG